MWTPKTEYTVLSERVPEAKNDISPVHEKYWPMLVEAIANGKDAKSILYDALAAMNNDAYIRGAAVALT